MNAPTNVSSFLATLPRTELATPRPTTGAPTPGVPGTTGTTGPSFTERLREAVDGVNQTQVVAHQASDAYANGESNDIHGTMIALEQADISFRVVSNIRSRLVEAYREVMRMGA